MKDKLDLLDLIKKTGAVRKFKDQHINPKFIKLISEAGLWGPSVSGVQPWRFVIIQNKLIIKKIASIVNIKSKKKEGAFAKLLQMTSKTINNSNVVAAIYITNRMRKNAVKYGPECVKRAWIAELLSTGAAVQNMFLMLNNLGLGGVWLEAPTIFSKEINNLLKKKNELELTALMVFGYPDQEISRCHREYAKIIENR